MIAATMAFGFFQLLQRTAGAQGTRTNVVSTLQGTLVITTGATVALAIAKAEPTIVAAAAIASGVVLLVNLAAYIFFALTKPELLQSEKFALRKMEIEQGFMGDDVAGFIKHARESSGALPPPAGGDKK